MNISSKGVIKIDDGTNRFVTIQLKQLNINPKATYISTVIFIGLTIIVEIGGIYFNNKTQRFWINVIFKLYVIYNLILFIYGAFKTARINEDLKIELLEKDTEIKLLNSKYNANKGRMDEELKLENFIMKQFINNPKSRLTAYKKHLVIYKSKMNEINIECEEEE